jgi:hypothetical protein
VDDLKFPHENIELLPLGKLVIDRRVQRSTISKGHVRKIAENFNEGAIGYLTVSARDNGTYAVLDGQHRKAALELLGHGEGALVPCDVRHGLSLQQEAALFLLLNTMNNPLPLDKFLVRVIEGDPVALDISAIVNEAGWQVGDGGRQGFIPAADALERVYTGRGLKHAPKGSDPAALRATLRILTSAWGHDMRAVHGLLLLGTGAVCRRDGTAVDAASLSSRLAKHAGGPAGVIGKAKSVAVGRGVQNAMSFVIVQIHNQKRRTRALPDWPLS